MSRIHRSLVAAAAACALSLLAGCSLISGPASKSTPPVVPQPAKVTTGTPLAATSTPAASAAASGSIHVPGVPSEPATISEDIDGVQLRDLVDTGALLVDVGSPTRFRREHIKGAENVPLAQFAATAEDWSRTRPVVVYDRTGALSQSAQSWMERNGFTAVYHLFRGVDGYDAALAGTHPRIIPPMEPVLYYFTMDDQPICAPTDLFIKQLRAELGGRFEYHGFDVTTQEGMSQLIRFRGDQVPMMRLIDAQGHTETFIGVTNAQVLRADLKRAIAAYEKGIQ